MKLSKSLSNVASFPFVLLLNERKMKKVSIGLLFSLLCLSFGSFLVGCGGGNEPTVITGYEPLSEEELAEENNVGVTKDPNY